MSDKECTVSRGKQGELHAEQLLTGKGFRVLARNYRCRRGEIDLVMQDCEQLVFVEVRLRANGLNVALESIDARKKSRIVMAARHYLAMHPTTMSCRFDVVCVVGEAGSPNAQALHLPAAFTLDDIYTHS